MCCLNPLTMHELILTVEPLPQKRSTCPLSFSVSNEQSFIWSLDTTVIRFAWPSQWSNWKLSSLKMAGAEISTKAVTLSTVPLDPYSWTGFSKTSPSIDISELGRIINEFASLLRIIYLSSSPVSWLCSDKSILVATWKQSL